MTRSQSGGIRNVFCTLVSAPRSIRRCCSEVVPRFIVSRQAGAGKDTLHNTLPRRAICLLELS